MKRKVDNLTKTFCSVVNQTFLVFVVVFFLGGGGGGGTHLALARKIKSD